MGKYKKFNETRREIIVLDEFVTVYWSNAASDHYESRGYKKPDDSRKFLCLVDDVFHGASQLVNVMCPVCEKSRMIPINTMLLTGHTLCKGCAKIPDLTGKKFNMLTVIGFSGKDAVNRYSLWLCRCECGTEKIISGTRLMRNDVVSCGCYYYQAMENVRGENHHNWAGGPMVVRCSFCGRKYKRQRTHITGESTFCSNKCRGKWMSENRIGDKAPNWKPELTDKDRERTRHNMEYRNWTKSVFDRDDYTCQCCKKKGGELNAHHKFSYAHYPEYRKSIEYGVTLCKECHRDFHFNYMKNHLVPCTPDDYNGWIESKGELS